MGIRKDASAFLVEDAGSRSGSPSRDFMPASLQDKSEGELCSLRRTLVRKLDTRLMPVLIIMFLLNILDRNNFTNARPGALEDDIGLTDHQYNTGLMIMYVGYLLFQFPSNILLSKFPRPGVYLAVAGALWGCVSASMAGVHSFGGVITVQTYQGEPVCSAVLKGGRPATTLDQQVLYRPQGKLLSAMGLNRAFTLNTGVKIPAVGFGTWQAPPNEVENAVDIALRSGYRHLDCAAIYRNETEVGSGIKESGVDRKEIFVTAKLWNTKHEPCDVEAALDQSLADLGLGWFPLDEKGISKLSQTHFTDTWRAMENLLKTDKTKAIGVSNFNRRRLMELLDVCSVRPAVNQIEAHHYLQQQQVLDFCKNEGILIEAYSPLGNNQTGELRTVDDKEVYFVGEDLGMDSGQVVVSWGVQRVTVVLPKSVTEKRIKGNFQGRVLPDSAMHRLNKLERHKRFNFPARWGFDIFDEAGEEKVRRIAKMTGAENLEKFTV